MPSSDPSTAPRPPVAFLAGATAVGKSDLALELAEAHGLEILSLDSRQIYRGLEKGTAKPSAAERSRVRHHLLDELDPSETCSAALFQQLYVTALIDLEARGRRGLAVGGTGFYWEACTRGLHPLPGASTSIRERMDQLHEEKGIEALHEHLERIDPVGSRNVPPRNRHRLIRAIELVEQTGQSLATLYEGDREGGIRGNGPVILLRRPREELYERINQRCEQMLADGLLAEVAGLLESGLSPEAPGFRTLGYREFLPHLLDGEPLEASIERFQRESRRYAKRQETWFRNQVPDAVEIVIDGEESLESLLARVEAVLKHHSLDTGDGAT